jgi:hypothetical protein
MHGELNAEIQRLTRIAADAQGNSNTARRDNQPELAAQWREIVNAANTELSVAEASMQARFGE